MSTVRCTLYEYSIFIASSPRYDATTPLGGRARLFNSLIDRFLVFSHTL
jgi:hypothetical protein